MKHAGQKSVKEELPEQRKGLKRAVECWLKVQTHVWELDAAGSNPATRIRPRDDACELLPVKRTVNIKFSRLAANALPAAFYAARHNACFSIGVSTPRLRCTLLVL